MGKLIFFLEIHFREELQSILLIKNVFGVIKTILGLVHASCSLPEWRAIKQNFFAP